MYSLFYIAQWFEDHQAKFERFISDGFEYRKLLYTSKVDDSRRAVLGIGPMDSLEAAMQLDQVLMELRAQDFSLSVVQPLPGWGALCEWCKAYDRDEFTPCKLSRVGFSVGIERRSPRGRSVTMLDVYAKDFIEECSHYEHTNN